MSTKINREVKTREEWLVLLTERFILPLLAAHDGNVSYKYRVSIGFPKGSRGGNRAVGQCWPTERSADKVHEIFVSPELTTERVVDVLIHEHVHGSVGLEAGHKAPFKRLAVAVGLEGKMTATVASAALKEKIAGWLTKLPAYPGATLKVDGTKSKPGSRLIKCQCAECGYVVRTARRWLDEVGAPHCPDHGEMVAA